MNLKDILGHFSITGSNQDNEIAIMAPLNHSTK
jgi:hypothetical protein